VRRYFTACEAQARTGASGREVETLELLMKQVGVGPDFSPAHRAALAKEEATGAPAGAMVLPDGTLVTGRTSELLGAASSLLINALKHMAGVDDEAIVISEEALAPICRLKTDYLNSRNPRLHSNEMLIALSTSAAHSPIAARVIEAADKLRGCDAYFSVIVSAADEKLYRTLGINVCCEPKFEHVGYYHR
jgi:uncharacterized protein (UPF0371 family)